MSFNPSKYTVIRVSTGKKKNVYQSSYTLDGQLLEVVDSSKYLGVTLTEDISWSKHISDTATKANRSPGFLQLKQQHMSPVKRMCVFEHSVMTNFHCACPAIQRGQGSGFLSEGSSWLTACMSEQRRFWRDCADAQARQNLRCSHRR